jgi:transcriptional regulator with XRE-family HTH domain
MEAETFWANVNQLIKEQKTTQETLAETIGTPFGTFRGWNFYNRLPDAVSAYRIAQSLNTSVEYLVSGTEPGNSVKPLLDDMQSVIDRYRKT